jgi:HEPN domain-containing protein
MKPLTREWIAKAETDFEDALRLLRVRNRKDFFTSSFHAQQSAEKYLKALLIERDRKVERTHDLAAILRAVADDYPMLRALEQAADELTAQAVRTRYPGETVSLARARRAVLASKFIRERIRGLLGIQSASRKTPKPKPPRSRKP